MFKPKQLNGEQVSERFVKKKIERGELAAIRAHRYIESMPIPTFRKKRLRVIDDDSEPIKSD